MLLGLLAACGEEPADRRAEPGPGPGRLAIGLSEANARLLGPPPAGTPAQPAFAAWRERIAAIAPAYVRLTAVWSQLQPSASAPPRFAAPEAGCVRDVQPCSAYAGLRDRLAAVRALGAQPVITIYSTPEWAARRVPQGAGGPRVDPSPGCGRAEAEPVARTPRTDAYRRFVRSLLAFVRREGARVAAWGPWNEPNHPAFLDPQRAGCDKTSPALSPDRYAELVRAFRAEAGPGARLLLGELAGYDAPRDTAVGAAEFAAALPRATACASNLWSLHSYVGSPSDREAGAPLAGDPARAGDLAVVDAVLGALEAKRCERRHRLWITETGVTGEERRAPQGCREMDAALRAWQRHRRVDAAFQYTVREDPLFRSGLAPARLGEPYPVYAAWAAWGGRKDPGAPATPRPC